jgi:predicted enzyme involved in methoxymalonyl-ACP biosynthesis
MKLNGAVGAEGLVASCEGRMVAAAWLSADGEELSIENWCMEVEDDSRFLMMDRIVEEASSRGCTRVRGEFRSTGTNEAMREFLAQFGFTMIGGDEESTLWILPVSAYEPMGM